MFRIRVLVFLLLLSTEVTAADRYVPAVARGAGANGTFFRSDLRIVNLSASAASVDLTFLPSGTDNRSAQTVQLSVGARESRDVDDVVQSVFGVSAGIGALRASSAADLVVTSRTYTTSGDPECPGTYGQFIPGLDASRAVTRGVIAHLGSSEVPVSGFRTNIGAVNLSGASVTVALNLRNGAGGASLGTATLALQPFGHLQQGLASLFSVAALTSSNLFLEIDAPSAVLAYASVVDNQSGDSIFVPAEPDSGTPGQGLSIIARQWEFEPSRVEVNAGEQVTIQVRAIDVEHGISFSGVGPFTCTSEQAGQCVLVPGQTVTVTFTPSQPGEFAFFCTRFCGGDGAHGHDTMRGTLVVK
jgi:cytochrome c oxidase subunit 2